MYRHIALATGNVRSMLSLAPTSVGIKFTVPRGIVTESKTQKTILLYCCGDLYFSCFQQYTLQPLFRMCPANLSIAQQSRTVGFEVPTFILSHNLPRDRSMGLTRSRSWVGLLIGDYDAVTNQPQVKVLGLDGASPDYFGTDCNKPGADHLRQRQRRPPLQQQRRRH